MDRMYALADCNNFYASCERIFRPDLNSQPLVVLSNNDGCAIARSNEIKKHIPMGAPIHKYQSVIKKYNIHVFSANFALYGSISRRVMEVLSNFSDTQEIYSIDEVFLDFSAVAPTDYLAYAKQARRTVNQGLSIPLSIGVAPTKTLAKLANEYAKKREDGVFAFTDETQIDTLLATTDIQDIWGIGARKAAFLRAHNITTALDLKRASDAWVKKHLSITGLRTVLEMRGIACIPLEPVSANKKQIICSRSFGRAVSNIAELKEAVSTYVSRAAEKLREQHSCLSTMTVYITTNSFQHDQPQYSRSCTATLPTPSNFTPYLVTYACSALEQIFRPGYRYHKAGVIFSDIGSDEHTQLDMFSSPLKTEKQRALMSTVDRINTKYGRNTIKLAATGIEKGWRMRQANKSQQYLSNWNELPIVKAQ